MRSRAVKYKCLTVGNLCLDGYKPALRPLSPSECKVISRHLPTGRTPMSGGVGADLLKFAGALFKGHGLICSRTGGSLLLQ